jgi:3-oxoacid CoA-transferase subunit A
VEVLIIIKNIIAPHKLLEQFLKTDKKNFHLVSNNLGTDDKGSGVLLLKDELITKVTCSYFGGNLNFQKKYFNGLVEVNLVPQGSLMEKIRR